VPGVAVSYPFGIMIIMNRMVRRSVFALTEVTSNEARRNRQRRLFPF
jgi:hypothetical protein